MSLKIPPDVGALMSGPSLVLLVRFKSALPLEEVRRIAEERADDFRALDGLRQKYYLHDPATGEIGGLYLWEGRAALDAYRSSALRATIQEAYQAQGEPRVELFEVLMPLREVEGA